MAIELTEPCPAIEAFLADLTALSIKHGIGLAGDVKTFLMERNGRDVDDWTRNYVWGADDTIVFI